MKQLKTTETKPIIVDAWCIDSPGDPPVGLFDYQELIQGPFTYDSEIEYLLARDFLKLAFQISVDEDVKVMTLKEWKQQIKEEDKWLNIPTNNQS